MSKLTYLRLRDHVGLEAAFRVDPKTGLEVPNPKAGQPAPLNNVGFQIPMPVMVGKEVGTTTSRATLYPSEELDPNLRARIIPGTRIVEAEHPAVIDVLVGTGFYEQCDPPAEVRSRKPKSTTTTAEA